MQGYSLAPKTPPVREEPFASVAFGNELFELTTKLIPKSVKMLVVRAMNNMAKPGDVSNLSQVYKPLHATYSCSIVSVIASKERNCRSS